VAGMTANAPGSAVVELIVRACAAWLAEPRRSGRGVTGRFAADFALGANAWGSAFVVGAGSTFPHCMQSEIANLAGSLTGKGDIQLGATVDGPSSAANFVGLGTVTGMKACSAGNFKPFDTASVGYEDNVLSWPSVEPADDYTAASLLAFALGAASGGRSGPTR
jgi:endoglucanase